MNRKNFLSRACLTGACFCGFAAMPGLANDAKADAIQDNGKQQLNNKWLSVLLSNLNQHLDEETLRVVLKKSAIIHYQDLNMDALLAEYVGNLEKFIQFLEKSWGWKIDYNTTKKVLIADENKNHCVCPIVAYKKELDTSAICYCSEGFAEKMFSTVVGSPVKARVISSVRKGDKTCKYSVDLAS